jgi:hypothetical protein
MGVNPAVAHGELWRTKEKPALWFWAKEDGGNRMKKNILLMSLLMVIAGELKAEVKVVGEKKGQRMADNLAVLGNFVNSCRVINYNPQTKELTCICKNEQKGLSGPTSYDISDCQLGTVQNINGRLGCALLGRALQCREIFGQPCCMLTPTMTSETYYSRYRNNGPMMPFGQSLELEKEPQEDVWR